MKARAWVGTSGWNYPHWKRRFYPEGLGAGHWLAHYAGQFATVELNRSFYRLPSPENFADWAAQTPEGFLIAVKATRFTTHIKRLKDAPQTVANLLEAARELGDKLGPVLFQLPPTMTYSAQRLQGLLDYLTTQDLAPGLRSVLEVRNASWLRPECFKQLEEARVALCLADHPALTVSGPLTAPFVYVRRHGPGGRWGTNYPEQMLAQDAALVRGWLDGGRDVYFYYNNDDRAYAVFNARRLLELTGSQSAPK
jgi:uncharacterized protein YecE (DUF72 family)